MNDEKLKAVHISNQKALKLLHECAPKQHRSLAGCASAAIISALSGQNTTSEADVKQGENEGDK